jgi:eukaryotic-like serine/threonine-protein kinase
MALPEILRIAAAVSGGLAASHAVGVVHRDLKPENIFFAGERVVITDFGIARPLAAHDALATSGGIVGTPAYMAPEQLGSDAIDGRADVFALGVVLFELLTGRLPFEAETAFATAAARLTTDAPDPRSLSPGVPEGIAELVLAMLARKREARPDAQTVAQRIEALRGGRRDITVRDTVATGARPTLQLLGSVPEGTPTVHVAPFNAGGSHLGLRWLFSDLPRAGSLSL